MGVNPQQQQQQQPGAPQQPGQPGPQQQGGQPVAQQQMVGPAGPRPQHNMVGNMYQQQQPPMYPQAAAGPGRAQWRLPQQRSNLMQPGQSFPVAGAAQAGQNQTSPLLAQLQTPPGVNQAQHTPPFGEYSLSPSSAGVACVRKASRISFGKTHVLRLKL